MAETTASDQQRENELGARGVEAAATTTTTTAIAEERMDPDVRNLEESGGLQKVVGEQGMSRAEAEMPWTTRCTNDDDSNAGNYSRDMESRGGIIQHRFDKYGHDKRERLWRDHYTSLSLEV